MCNWNVEMAICWTEGETFFSLSVLFFFFFFMIVHKWNLLPFITGDVLFLYTIYWEWTNEKNLLEKSAEQQVQ